MGWGLRLSKDKQYSNLSLMHTRTEKCWWSLTPLSCCIHLLFMPSGFSVPGDTTRPCQSRLKFLDGATSHQMLSEHATISISINSAHFFSTWSPEASSMISLSTALKLWWCSSVICLYMQLHRPPSVKSSVTWPLELPTCLILSGSES